MKQKQISIAIDARMLENSGIGTLLKNTIPFLLEDPCLDITLMGYQNVFEKYVWTKKAKLIFLKSKIYSFQEQLELPFKIPKTDIFWSPHYNIPLLPIKAKKRLTTICDVYHLAFFSTLTISQKIYSKIVFKNAKYFSDRIITISNFSKKEIIKYLAVKKEIDVIYCGKNITTQFNENMKFNYEYILFVGNVKPHKNIKMAIIAFNQILKYYPNLKFVIVGKRDGFITTDTELHKILTQCKQESIKFTGYIDDLSLNAFYKNAKALIFPSLYEGFGLPILEAMSFGTPVISSNRASLPEVGGKAIKYFDPENIEEITNVLRSVLNEAWIPNLDEIKNQLNKFDWKRSSESYVKIIMEMAS